MYDIKTYDKIFFQFELQFFQKIYSSYHKFIHHINRINRINFLFSKTLRNPEIQISSNFHRIIHSLSFQLPFKNFSKFFRIIYSNGLFVIFSNNIILHKFSFSFNIKCWNGLFSAWWFYSIFISWSSSKHDLSANEVIRKEE